MGSSCSSSPKNGSRTDTVDDPKPRMAFEDNNVGDATVADAEEKVDAAFFRQGQSKALGHAAKEPGYNYVEMRCRLAQQRAQKEKEEKQAESIGNGATSACEDDAEGSTSMHSLDAACSLNFWGDGGNFRTKAEAEGRAGVINPQTVLDRKEVLGILAERNPLELDRWLKHCVFVIKTYPVHRLPPPVEDAVVAGDKEETSEHPSGSDSSTRARPQLVAEANSITSNSAASSLALQYRPLSNNGMQSMQVMELVSRTSGLNDSRSQGNLSSTRHLGPGLVSSRSASPSNPSMVLTSASGGGGGGGGGNRESELHFLEGFSLIGSEFEDGSTSSAHLTLGLGSASTFAHEAISAQQQQQQQEQAAGTHPSTQDADVNNPLEVVAVAHPLDDL